MKKTSVKHIVNCGAFLVGLAVLLLIVSYLYRPRDNTKEGGMDYVMANGYLGQPSETIDIFFVGSSEVYSGVCPMRLWDEAGITSYDTATGAHRVYNEAFYVEQILRTHHPKMIVLDAYSAVLPASPDSALYTEWSKLFPILRYHENWKTFNFQMFFAPVEYTHREVNRGFRPRGAVEKVSSKGFMKKSSERAFLSPLNRIYLDHIKRLCDDQGVQLMYIALPSPKNWNYARHNTMEAYATENDIPFLDLNLKVDDIGIDFATDYRDNGDHLNGPGAKKVSIYLAKVYAETYGMEDHRQDEACAFWHEDYEKYPEL